MLRFFSSSSSYFQLVVYWHIKGANVYHGHKKFKCSALHEFNVKKALEILRVEMKCNDCGCENCMYAPNWKLHEDVLVTVTTKVNNKFSQNSAWSGHTY